MFLHSTQCIVPERRRRFRGPEPSGGGWFQEQSKIHSDRQQLPTQETALPTSMAAGLSQATPRSQSLLPVQSSQDPTGGADNCFPSILETRPRFPRIMKGTAFFDRAFRPDPRLSRPVPLLRDVILWEPLVYSDD